MSDKDKVWIEMGKAWDKFITNARKYCKSSTQFQCDAELLGYCISQLSWDADDMDDVMEWIQQGMAYGETQKLIARDYGETIKELGDD